MKTLINWFEIPVNDMERARKFYGETFQTEMPVSEMFDALMAFFTTDKDALVSGALIKHEWAKPSMDGAIIYFNCGEDLLPFQNRAEAAGGKVLVPKTQIAEGHGYYAIIADTEGNKFGLHSI